MLLYRSDLVSFSAKWVSFSGGVNDGASHTASLLGFKDAPGLVGTLPAWPFWVVFPGSLLPAELGEQRPPRGTGAAGPRIVTGEGGAHSAAT